MAQISNSQVFEGVAAELESLWQDKKVYQVEVPQNLTEGSFCLNPVNVNITHGVSERSTIAIMLDVIYYPLNGDITDSLNISTVLPKLLETITTPNGDKVHSTSADIEIVDGVLHCVVTFTFDAFITFTDSEEETTELMYFLEYSEESEV